MRTISFRKIRQFFLVAAVAMSMAVGVSFWPEGVAAQSAVNADGPVIDVWYGANQKFDNGTPQEWINILGNVSDPDGVSALSYTLNGGSAQTLSIGPDGRRLADDGDFVVEIDRNDVQNGPNTVVITATDGLDNTSTTTVTFTYAVGKVWPLPYSIDWSSVGNLQDVAQVVDGEWTVSVNGVRTDEIEYDRVLAIGDLAWTDYEATVPITVHEVQATQRDGAGVGMWMRWTGHTNSPVNCSQPHCGWLPSGLNGWYTFEPAGGGANNERLNIWGVSDGNFTMNVGQSYTWKMRVETVGGNRAKYSLKVWQSGQNEPTNWTIERTIPGGNRPETPVQAGSLILVAHNVDATFGDLTVTPLSSPPTTYTLDVTEAGQGSVTRSPDKSEYEAGEQVTLTATPDPGWRFDGWSGDADGNGSPIVITMDDDKSVTATFSEEPPPTYTLTVDVQGQGEVTLDPDGGVYESGQVVTLTAVPDLGWRFDGWTGAVTSSNAEVNLTMNGNQSVTATFSQEPPPTYTLTVDVQGQGEVTLDPAGGVYVAGQVVTLTATPTDGWRFDGWTGDLGGTVTPTQITMNGAKSVGARFSEEPPLTYTLNVEVEGQGTVQLDPAGGVYAAGQEVALTAVPADGWRFVGWSGDLGLSENPTALTMNDDKRVEARFGEATLGSDTYALSVEATGSGEVAQTPDQAVYAAGDEVTLTATGAVGWDFDRWSGDLDSSENPATIIMDENKTVTAIFVEVQAEQQVFLPLVSR